MHRDRIIALLFLTLLAGAANAQSAENVKEVLRARLLNGICGTTCGSVGTVVIRSVTVTMDGEDSADQAEEEVIYAQGKPLVRHVRVVPQSNHLEVRMLFGAQETVIITDLGNDSAIVRHVIGLAAVTPLQLRDPAFFAAVDLSLLTTDGGEPVIQATYGELVTRWTLDTQDRVITTRNRTGETTCSDFRRVNGVTVPFRCDTVSNGSMHETRAVVAVLVNSAIPEAVYEVP